MNPADLLTRTVSHVLTETMTVADIASAVPSSVRVFEQYGIDFCCGGRTPLGEACRERGVPFAEVAGAIQASAGEPADDEIDWNQAPLDSLIAFIVTRFHDRLRDELPRLESMASKVSRVHGAKATHLSRVEAIVTELSADMQAHMHKEEGVLFPAIRAVEKGATPAIPLSRAIAVMEHEHEAAGGLLAELRALTHGFAVPEWGCGTFRAFYDGLAELEADMHVHVHLENNVLFPRAVRSVDAGAIK